VGCWDVFFFFFFFLYLGYKDGLGGECGYGYFYY